MAKRKRSQERFLARHSLSVIVAAIWLFWLVMYQTADPRTHLGAFYGNSIADWLGMLMFIVATKYFFEVGSKESRAGQVYGNIVSEWGQLLMLIIMTKYFREVGSKES